MVVPVLHSRHFTPPDGLGLKAAANARMPMDHSDTLAFIVATTTPPPPTLAEFRRQAGYGRDYQHGSDPRPLRRAPGNQRCHDHPTAAATSLSALDAYGRSGILPIGVDDPHVYAVRPGGIALAHEADWVARTGPHGNAEGRG